MGGLSIGLRTEDLGLRDACHLLQPNPITPLTSTDGRSRTSSTAVPDAVLPPPSMESCASRHLHVSATAPALLYLPTSL